MSGGKFIPYGRQSIHEDDIAAVISVLKSDWLTTGPMVPKFEEAIAEFTGAKFAVAVSSGTAGLHAAVFGAGIGPGDEVIVPPLTFAATANAVLYQGGTPVFADILPDTLLIDPDQVKSKITKRTKAILAVDYGGHPADYKALGQIAEKHGLVMGADACHSIGGLYHGKKVGTLTDLSVLSFHPVKHITTAEGGMILTDNEAFARRMHLFRNHGIGTDHRERAEKGTLGYEMIDLGYNYRLTDLQCALGLSQLQKLPGWIERRNQIADLYEKKLSNHPLITLLRKDPKSLHAHHLFVIKIDFTRAKIGRDELALKMKALGVGINVHYPLVHLHPYYRERFGYKPGHCPVAEAAHREILSLPMYADLTNENVDYVVDNLLKLIG